MTAPKQLEVRRTGRSRLYGVGIAYRKEMRAAEHRCVRQMDPGMKFARPFEMREVQSASGGTSLRFLGIASVVDKSYVMSDMFGEFTETIVRGAFDKTLAQNADVNFLCNHTGVTMARTKSGTLQLTADNIGLHVDAKLNPERPDVQIVRSAVQDGDLDEMSFSFRVVNQEWDENFENRRVIEINLSQGDTSVVNFGASPHTAGSTSIRAGSAVPIIPASNVAAARAALARVRNKRKAS
jgi:HK97 family phage prohead protease